MKTKRMLLTTLLAFTLFGIAGCKDKKKGEITTTAKEAFIPATEAKAIVVEAGTKTEEKLEKTATININNFVNGNINATNVKADSLILAEKANLTLSNTTNISAAYNLEDKKAKLTASADAKLDGTLTSTLLKGMMSWESPKTITYTANGTAEAYYVAKDNGAKIYAKYGATLDDNVVTDFDLDTGTYSGKYNFTTEMISSLFSNYGISSLETTTNFDFIKDWGIFKKDGEIYIADCSNLSAFDFGDKFNETKIKLKAIGLDLKVSKFQFELNNDKTFKNFDLEFSLSGNTDLSKASLSKETIAQLAGYISMVKPELAPIISALPLDKLGGAMDVNINLGNKITLDYATATITVPSDLTSVEETDLDEIILDILLGNTYKNAAIHSAEEIFQSAKMCIIEATALGTSTEVVTKSGDTYTTTFKTLYDEGEININPFDTPNTTADGGMTISYNAATETWTVTVSQTINSYVLSYSNNTFQVVTA